ncbi:MAG: hypothetical protein ACI4IL_01415 [Eubacterium sp.]
MQNITAIAISGITLPVLGLISLLSFLTLLLVLFLSSLSFVGFVDSLLGLVLLSDGFVTEDGTVVVTVVVTVLSSGVVTAGENVFIQVSESAVR